MGRASRYRVAELTDTREDVKTCRSLVEARGMEFLVLDQTRPDIGMPVARVIVPVEMGHRSRPLSETGLNPAPVIA